MDLHRATGSPDWEAIAASKRNIWQRLGAASAGWVTPSNVITILGLAVVLLGLVEISRHHYWQGALGLLLGRLCDILDGWLAQVTGTKSPTGEGLDAAADKVATFATLAVLFYTQVAPRWIIIALLITQLTIAVTVLSLRRRKIYLHPPRVGKTAMALAWLSLMGFVVARAAQGRRHATLYIISIAIAAISIALSSYVALQYSRRRN